MLVLLVAAAAGTLIGGSRIGLALRSALGLAVVSQVLYALAWLGWLNPSTSAAVAVAACCGGFYRGLRLKVSWSALCLFLATFPLLALALQPPLAFDETLYHLPFVREFAAAGGLVYLPALRFPVFPTLHEVLCVPVYFLAGDTASHLVSLAQTLVTAALVFEWAGGWSRRAGWLAAALLLGSPNVLELSLINYVDAALTLFVTAGFYSLDRSRPVLAGFFLGTAFAVKYLAAYFIAAAVVLGAFKSARQGLTVGLASTAAALPTLAWLVATTGNPLFPYVTGVFGANEWFVESLPVSPLERCYRWFRVLYDVSFACDRVNYQAPMTPFLLPMVGGLLWRRELPRCRALLAVGALYLAIFTFLPQDSRYLVPLLPALCVVAAQLVPPASKWFLVLALAPGVLYLGVRLHRDGLPPTTPLARRQREEAVRPALVALRKAGPTRVYCLRGEELQGLAPGTLQGDWFGPFSFGRIRGSLRDTRGLATRLGRLGFDYLLVPRGSSPPLIQNGGLELVYGDAAAELWKVQPVGNP